MAGFYIIITKSTTKPRTPGRNMKGKDTFVCTIGLGC